MKTVITVIDSAIDISGDMKEITDLGITYEPASLRMSQDAQVIEKALKDADYIIAGSERLDEETMSLLPKLKLIVRNGVGYDSVDLRAASKLGIAVCNLPGSNAFSVAEHVLGMMIGITRHMPLHTQRIKEDRYGAFIGDSLCGRVGLIGFGAISRHLAKLLSVFDAETVSCDPYVDEKTMAGYNVKKVEMEELLSGSNIVSLHLPATEDNRHMVNREFISRMQDGAYFINCARGSLVDEEALADALLSGKLSGAGLDAFDPEPIRSGSRLLQAENVILTPHSSTGTYQCFHTVLKIAAHSIADFYQGKEPFHLLNPDYVKNAKKR